MGAQQEDEDSPKEEPKVSRNIKYLIRRFIYGRFTKSKK